MYRPTEIKQRIELHIFRKGFKPLWEQFKEGGTWTLKEDAQFTEKLNVDWRWETSLFNFIGEEFPNSLKGLSLSVRGNGFCTISFWQDSGDQATKDLILEKLKLVLKLEERSHSIYFKSNQDSLKVSLD